MGDTLSTINFSRRELDTKKVDQKTLDIATKLYKKNGFLILKNILNQDVIKDMCRSYLEDNKDYFTDNSSLDASDVGHRRKMITVEIKPPFNTDSLYANPFILPIIIALLGKKIILGSLGSVAAMPNSDAQHIHFDHPNLFDDNELENIIDKLPPFAITVIIPLVNITQENGPTRMWPGSHLKERKDKQKLLHTGEYFDPIASEGDCILFDYRMLHGGMPNKSLNIRPILYVVYYRYWFRDVVNYAKQKPLIITQKEYIQIPDKYKYLFTWTIENDPLITDFDTSHIQLPRNSPCHCGSGLRFKQCHGKLI